MDTPEPASAGIEESEDQQLSRMEKELSPPSANPDSTAPKTDDAPPAPDRAGDAGTPDESAPSPDPKRPDIQSDAEEKAARTEAEKEGKELALDDKGKPKRDDKGKFVKQDKKPVEPAVKLTPDETKKFSSYLKTLESKFAQDMGKRLIRWDSIKEVEQAHTEKVKADELRMANAIKSFNADVEAFKAEQQQSQITPEKWDQWAANQLLAAAEKQTAAEKAEKDGNFDLAEKLKDEVKFLRRDAATGKENAEALRKNPPKTDAQKQEQFQTDQRQWIGKAATDFPEFGKKGSEIQSAAAERFKQLVAETPQLGKFPGLIYYCAEYAALKTAADRVSVLEKSVSDKDKELGELKTKLTEADALLNPSPSGGAARLPKGQKARSEMTLQEEMAALQAEAAQMG